LKKHLTIRPLIKATTACLVPLAVHAQDTGVSQPSLPATQAAPTTPSVPSTPTLPTTPSQPAGIPYPSGVFYPGSTYQPAGTQASTVYDEAGPGFQFRAMGGMERESNATRSASGGVSDTVFLLGVGMSADARFGLQRLRADVEANRYRYDRDSTLNYNVLNYALAWDWSITPRFHGVLAADRKQYRDIATDPVALVNRMGRRTERTELAEGVWEAGSALRLAGSLSHSKASTTAPVSWDALPEVTSARVGVGYELPSGTSVYVRQRRGNGEYTDPTAGAPTGDFDEDETDVVLKWPITAKTSIDARLGHVRRKHDSAPQNDFSGGVGSAAVAWDATAKTRLLAGVSRDLSATGQATGGHVSHDRFFLGPVWKATEQIAVNLRYDRISRDWKGVPAGSSEAGRKEAVRVLSAGVEWAPRRWLAVTGYVRGERQSSNLNSGYRNTTVGAAVKAFF
jgi:exopolysaccharide biosynthesis operon protein EpsL